MFQQGYTAVFSVVTLCVHDLVLVISSPPLIKVASNTRQCSKLGGTTLNGGEEGGESISHRRVTSSDLK